MQKVFNLDNKSDQSKYAFHQREKTLGSGWILYTQLKRGNQFMGLPITKTN